MSDAAPVSDQTIEFFGELYLHEPDELRSRVQFHDYLLLLLRYQERVRSHDSSHVHRCDCGTFLLCDRPDKSDCGNKPCCRDCDPRVAYRARHIAQIAGSLGYRS